MVYEDAEKLYAEIAKDAKQLLEEAFSALFPKSVSLSSLSSPKTSPVPVIPAQGRLFAFNPTFFPRRDVVEIPLGSAFGTRLHLDGEIVQKNVKDGKENKAQILRNESFSKILTC